jgi:chaperonin GroES
MSLPTQNSMMQGGMTQPGTELPVMPPNPQQAEVPEPSDYMEGPQETEEPKYRKHIEAVNIAKDLDDDKLSEIGDEAKRGFDVDRQSRKEWEDDVKEWTKLAIQTREQKSYPWPKASNVKYPLLSTAAMQFAARAYPSLVPSDGKVVKAQVVGKDPTGQKQDKAQRVSTYMSYQLMREMYCWEEDMDKLLIMLPVVGTIFKKTYFDKLEDKPASTLVMPLNLVVNYWTKSLRETERISEIIEMSPRILKERQNADIFLDIDLENSTEVMRTGNAPPLDDTTPFNLVEQHTYLDLDDDGYKEPYIVTFQMETGRVLRIVARYDETCIKTKSDGSLIRIEPIQYYTKFSFIPNPEGGFYDIGFGLLLSPLNESVNTLINQLIDSGTINQPTRRFPR